MYDTIIVGGGVAGLTAGMYLARANASTLILESKFWGGQTAMLNKVSNYPAVKETSGYDISNTLYEQVKNLDVEMKNEIVTKLKQLKSGYQVTTNKGKYISHNVIIATGAKTAQLGLQEEKKFVGRGVSYCATCDGNFFKKQPVAVYGLSAGTVEDIKYLQNVVSKVYWIIPSKTLPANVLQQVKSIKNLTIQYSSEVLNLVGDMALQEIVVLNKSTHKQTNLQVAGLFVSLGRNPDLSWVEVDIKTNKNGYVLVDKNCQTSLKGIFACGDITARELKQIVTACSDGAIAASYIIKNR